MIMAQLLKPEMAVTELGHARLIYCMCHETGNARLKRFRDVTLRFVYMLRKRTTLAFINLE